MKLGPLWTSFKSPCSLRSFILTTERESLQQSAGDTAETAEPTEEKKNRN